MESKIATKFSSISSYSGERAAKPEVSLEMYLLAGSLELEIRRRIDQKQNSPAICNVVNAVRSRVAGNYNGTPCAV